MGSQFKLWVPSNAAQINFQWTRSATDSQCISSAWAYLYGKWATYPCNYFYGWSNTPCDDDNASFGFSSTSPRTFSLNAYNSEDLQYWYYGGYGNDFIRGDYLYLTSYLDLDYNCTATLTVTFDYCGAGTIAASDDNNQSSVCVAYTNVTSTSYTEIVPTMTGPFTKNYLLNLPHNVAGVSFTVTKPTTDFPVYLYGRESSGGSTYNNYNYDYSYFNTTLWIANPAAGEFVLTLQAPNGVGFSCDVHITVETCPDGIAADRNGACLYPLTQVTTYDLAYMNVYVPPYNPSINTDCNWSFLAYTVAPETWGYMNLTVNTLNGYMYWRRNAIPNDYYYDGYTYQSQGIINFTPEDFYASKPVTYYFGFCNYNTQSYANFTIYSTYQGPSPSPSASPLSYPSASPSSHPSSSPSSVPSMPPSASPSPDSDSSSDGPEPSEGVYVLLLVVGFLLGVIVGLILGFYIYSKVNFFDDSSSDDSVTSQKTTSLNGICSTSTFPNATWNDACSSSNVPCYELECECVLE